MRQRQEEEEEKKKVSQMKPFIFTYLPVSGRCQDFGGKRALVGYDDTSVGQQINPALKIHECMHDPGGCSHSEQMGQCYNTRLFWEHTSTRF